MPYASMMSEVVKKFREEDRPLVAKMKVVGIKDGTITVYHPQDIEIEVIARGIKDRLALYFSNIFNNKLKVELLTGNIKFTYTKGGM